MAPRKNEYGQPIGAALPDWSPRPEPAGVTLQGSHCKLEPLDAERHAADLHAAYQAAPDGRDWTYLSVERPATLEEFTRYAENAARSSDPRHYAVIDLRTGKAVGTLSLMRITPAAGVIEVGHVTFSPLLKRTPISTEAQYLLMAYVFDQLGYRRYEWKCDSLNAPSRLAADRLGFTFEGVFRQLVVYKGRSRDTAWYSIIDAEWPLLKQAFETWLAPENHDARGQQKQSLSAIREALGRKR
ncbi:GNAT family N-acetyltransferase [Bordetella genomosp. 10]|uniref:GNAT family N-acetyltransferase n=1 Tax=Bordetella genomosp. 10 TaxID=1416804 RepID=A0A261S2H5_9BORD|nr:GNAT family protein [Bordetella genomosp. 10]OZI31549.1 GNAT family N-acetyltransferase [Bordetella genomosp. 10]